MKIVVAVDSFKGCLTSEEAGTIIADALRVGCPGSEVAVIPMADGGEGTTDAVLRAAGGELRSVLVCGPLGDPVQASFGLLAGGRVAVMEMASASGIELVAPADLDPLRATTYGTGELILAALESGASEIVLGIGGSATVDGGAGMAQALGYRLLTAEGMDCVRGGAALSTIADIEDTGVTPNLNRSRVRVACDVTNPLLGAHGAARIFGPQKGATPKMVEELELGLANLAKVWLRESMLDSVDQPGDGAAGGLGAGLRAFCRAERRPGAELVAELTGFDERIHTADLLVTGEGRTDEQTADGKLPAVLAAKAKMAGVRTILISGAVRGDISALDGFFDAVYATVDGDALPEEAVRQGRANLAKTAAEVAAEMAAR